MLLVVLFLFSSIEYCNLTARNEKKPLYRGDATVTVDGEGRKRTQGVGNDRNHAPGRSRQPPSPEIPLNNNFDRQIGVVHISGFDRYLAKLSALPVVSFWRQEKQREQRMMGRGLQRERERGGTARGLDLRTSRGFVLGERRFFLLHPRDVD